MEPEFSGSVKRLHPASSKKAGAAGSEKKVKEQQHHPNLVGRIVEKGFSTDQKAPTLSSFPPPSVLPFPVARHRSQGPHWAPAAPSAEVAKDDDDEDDFEGGDYTAISSFAGPIPKKERKGLDFSRWKEFASKDGQPLLPEGSHREVKNRTSTNPNKLNEQLAVKAPAPAVSGVASESKGLIADDRTRLGLLKGEKSIREGVSNLGETSIVRNGNYASKSQADKEMGEDPSSMSLADDIDVENRAKLEQMSASEIAEAQADLMNRMKPGVLDMLKKRGRDKLVTKRTQTEFFNDKQNGNANQGEGAKGLDMEGKRAAVNDAQEPPGGGAKEAEGATNSHTEAKVEETRSSGIYGSRQWKAWSETVERVRYLRFSLDGNVVDSCSPEEANESRQYKAENASERDFLRTEGDPAAAGYTIGEALALVRSMVPAQRSFALQLLASVLERALKNLRRDTDCSMESESFRKPDWQAVWAYALGPEPEIALSLRIALDDNHNSVVLASAKVIHCLLSCELNDSFFSVAEKLHICGSDAYTAPVFRARPEVDSGFLPGGFWKYSTKASNVLPPLVSNEDKDDEGKHTVQDDVVVAGQDVAAGLVRMGILPRICYLLEMDSLPLLKEYLVSILIGIARHSPTCANAVMTCPRLVQTVIEQFTKSTAADIHPYQIKSVALFKVLSKASKQYCLEFINRRFFPRIMWQLYKATLSVDDWVRCGRECGKLSSSLMVQQLRFWKVCIKYGYCLSYFTDFFSAMCFWLSPPTVGKLVHHNLLDDFASVALESFHVLEALSQKLPNLHSVKQQDKSVKENFDTETWSWTHVGPMVELAMKWLSWSSISIKPSKSDTDHSENSLPCNMLWVLSAVVQMLSTIFDRITPDAAANSSCNDTSLPWLPDFVPKVGLEIVRGGYFTFCDPSGSLQERSDEQSLVSSLCQLRCHPDFEVSISSVCCLNGLVKVVLSVDKCIQRAKSSVLKCELPVEGYNPSTESRVLEEGIAKWAYNDLERMMNVFINLVASRSKTKQSIEMFGRGGPAPGVGIGWGFIGGGYWSNSVLLEKMDAMLILCLHQILPLSLDKDLVDASVFKDISTLPVDFMLPTLQKLNSVMGICLVAGPEDKTISVKAWRILLQYPALKSLNFCIQYFSCLYKRPFDFCFTKEDYSLFGETLDSHFQKRWLFSKKKSSSEARKLSPSGSLETIDEESEESEPAHGSQDDILLIAEWAYQRLPLPIHWLLSPICTVTDDETVTFLKGSSKTKRKIVTSPTDASVTIMSGLFFLLGVETMSYLLLPTGVVSPVLKVPLVWKLHALSMTLLQKVDLAEMKTRSHFEMLQALYGDQVNLIGGGQSNSTSVESGRLHFLKTALSAEFQSSANLLDFKSEVHESYNTFIEILVDQFASVSYGDVIYARQVAVYLHSSVESSIRLATWNTLSGCRVLELLPPLEKCIAGVEGYLKPLEEDERILEAYAKSWASGALDKAATRGSMSYNLALHHLSCFIFDYSAPDKLSLRNRLIKSLLRGLSRQQHHMVMMFDMIKYRSSERKVTGCVFVDESEIKRKFMILSEACEGNSSLLGELQKLKASQSS